jgi:rsbT antagonist protein RsbS
MPVPVLKQGEFLIATVPSTLTDADWRTLQDDLLARVGQFRSRGVVLDVTDLDVMDSYATRTLRAIADAAHLRGAKTVLVGIQPDVAFAMVQLGLTARFEGVATALDLEEGLVLLAQRNRPGRGRGRGPRRGRGDGGR